MLRNVARIARPLAVRSLAPAVSNIITFIHVERKFLFPFNQKKKKKKRYYYYSTKTAIF